jgi:hypothetical protein
MKRSFSRSIETSSLFRGVGGPAQHHHNGAVGAPIRRSAPLVGGSGAHMEGAGAAGGAEVASVLGYGLMSGIQFYGVMLAIKGSLAYGAAAFIGGPIVVGMLMTQIAVA